ncbi:MAG: diguanylate cyclase [Anaerolineaceae bacterium]
MILLDLRTVFIGYVLTAAISSAVIITLYYQNRSRSSGLGYWPVAFIMQFLGMLLISLRGVIPDVFSIVVGNTLLILQTLFIYFGLALFLKQTVSRHFNYYLLVVFICLMIFYSYAQPFLLARNIIFSLTLTALCGQAAWLVLHRIDTTNLPSTRMAGFIFCGYILFSIFRILSDLIIKPGTDLFTSSLPDMLIILTYQMLSIGLTFTLFLMVNRSLVNDLEDDINKRALVEDDLRRSEEKFAAAFHNIPDALVVSLASDGTVLEVNESFSRITGFSRDEVIGKSTIDLKIWTSPEDRKTYADELIRAGRVSNFEAKFLQKNGQAILGLISSEVIQLTQGECFLNIIRDITESKKTEVAEKEQRVMAEALRDSAAALNSTLNFNEVLERILDNVGRVTPHDTANIMVMDGDDSAVILRCRGYVERGEADLTNQSVSLKEMPILKRVARQGKPLAVPDTTLDPDWNALPVVCWVKSYTVAPIRIRHRTIGFLNLESATAGFFNIGDAEHLQAFADQASIAIDNARLYEDVHELAITDDLTGLFNRRGLSQLGEREVIRSQRFQHPLAAIMVDIDHFKDINDTYGHMIGDRFLCALAACLKGNVRNVDLVARFGGEEFFILLTETDLDGASSVAERIRQAVEKIVIPVEKDEKPTGRTGKMTVSLGLVMLENVTPNLNDLIERADQLMYTAKKSGRNRVVFAAHE